MPDTNAEMPIEWHDLLRVETDSITTEIRPDLEQVWRLVEGPYPQAETLACAAALLTDGLGSITKFNPVSLPFGSGNPDREIKHSGWVLQEDLERVAMQVLGFAKPDQSAETTALQMRIACEDAVSSGLLESQRFDAWRPGMESGAGWTKAYRATTYGVLRARRAPVQSNGFHPEPLVRSQQPTRIEEEKQHPASIEPKVVKPPVAADAPKVDGCSDVSTAAVPANASVGDITIYNDFSSLGAFLERYIETLRTERPDKTSAEKKAPTPIAHPKKCKKRMSAKEAEKRAAEILASDGWPGGLRALAKDVGCSHELLRRCPSVKPYLKRSPKPVVSENPADLEGVASGAPDPLEHMAFEEDLERMRAELTSDQCQQIDDMSPDQQRRLVETWRDQRRDAIAMVRHELAAIDARRSRKGARCG